MGMNMKCTLLEGENSRILGREKKGDPVAAETCYGAGKTLRIGTVFFQRYLSNPIKSQLAYFKKYTNPSPKSAIYLKNSDHILRMRFLKTKDVELEILMNRGLLQTAELVSNIEGKLYDIDNHLICCVSPGEVVKVHIETDSILLLKTSALDQ